MDIHQMQVSYDSRADRLLWHIRMRDGAMVSVWLTRRLMLRLWGPFQQLVSQAGLPQVMHGGAAVAVPEAQAMMAEVARQRPLPGADFQAAFESKPRSRPLGAEPLLPDTVELTPLPKPVQAGQSSSAAAGALLGVGIREHEGRSFQIQLNTELATGLMRLLDQALAASEWLNASPVASDAVRAPASAATPPVFS